MSLILVRLASLLMILGVIGGSVYLYSYSRSKNSDADRLVDSAQKSLEERIYRREHLTSSLSSARALLAEETDRLEELRLRFNSAPPLAPFAIGEYTAAEKAVLGLNTIFTSDNPVLAEAKTDKQNIQSILTSWKNLIASSPSTNTLISAAKQNSPTILSGLQNLQNIVNNLNPANSGLTPAEIQAYQNTVDNAIQQVQDAINATNEAQTPVTPQDIADQQEAVENAQEAVENIEEEIEEIDNSDTTPPPGNNNDPNTPQNPPQDPPNDPFNPPYTPPIIDPNKPTLIQGSNPF